MHTRVKSNGLRGVVAMVATLGCLLLVGCDPSTESSSEGKKKPKPARSHLVEVAVVAVDDLRARSVYTGSLRYRQKIRVFTQEAGRITQLDVFEGDRVTLGQSILALDDTLLRAEIAKATALRRESEANLKRLRRLRAKRAIADEEHLRGSTAVEVARADERILVARLGYTQIRSPIAGIVAARLAEPGDFVDRNTHVLTLVDPKSLVTELSVSEMVLPHVSPSDAVDIRIDALGTHTFVGRVQRVYPEIDPASRQGKVEVVLDSIPQNARAGQFARVTLTTTALARRVVPFAAIRRDREGEYVFRLDEESRARRVAVRTGQRIADRVEVLDGLNPGEEVVVRGFLGLNDGKLTQPVRASRPVEPATDQAVSS